MKITGDVDELMRAVALVVTKLRCGARARRSVRNPAKVLRMRCPGVQLNMQQRERARARARERESC